MGSLARFLRRLLNVIRPGRAEAGLEREIAAHLALLEDEYRRRGRSADEARRAARLALGGVEQTKEHHRDARSFRWLDDSRRDIVHAFRSLRRTPVFAVTAALVLGLGIGINAMVFAIVNTLLLQPLPFERADDIVQVRRRTPFGSSGSFPMHDYLALTTGQDALASLAILDVFTAGRYTLTTNGGAESITACRVSAAFFDVLGVSAVHGRVFAEGADAPGAPLTAVITRAFWNSRFAGDAGIVGRFLTINGRSYTVIGVVPDSVRAFSPADMYLSLPVPRESRDRTNSFQVLARIAPGVSLSQAEARIDTIARQHAEASASLTNMPEGIVLLGLQDTFVGSMRPALEALMAAVSLVLLIACSNVANLVLARATARRREIAVMAALGASRWRIVRHVLAENLVVAAAGGAAGLLLASAALDALPALSGIDLPQAERIHIDPYVIAYVAGISTLAGLLAGLTPAVQLTGGQVLRWMKDTSAQGGSGAAGHRMRAALTLSQIALSTMLLAGAGLLARSFWNLASVDPGFEADGVLTMSVSMTPARYPDAARLAAYTDAVNARLERIPAVAAASSTTALPSEFPIDFPVSAVGRPDPSAANGTPAPLDAWYRAIDPHFFAAMRIPLVQGRVLTESDTATSAPIVVISQSLARAAFPDGRALGQALVIGRGYLTTPSDLRPRTIVGIVGDTREQGLRFAPTLTTYVPVAQAPERITQLVLEKIPLRWVVRSDRGAADLASAVRQAVLAVDPTQPPADFARMTDVLGRSIAPHRFNMLMLTAFSVLAVALASIGVYGLTAYAVTQRRREIGIRVSLGASRTRLVRGIVGQGLRLSAAGTALGLLGAVVLGRFLRTLLFGISAADGVTMAASSGAMTMVVAAATYLPAARACRLNPTVALRED